MNKRFILLLGLALSLILVTPAMAALSSDQVLSAVDKVTPATEQAAQKLWDLSEISLLEEKSSAYLKDVLKKNGFKITSEGTANVHYY